MLTKQQQQIIADMTNSFAKVNERFNTSKSFNLINADELHMLNRKKREFEDNVEIVKENWEMMASLEAYRIIELLKEDLPNAIIQKMEERCSQFRSVIEICKEESDKSSEFTSDIQLKYKNRIDIQIKPLEWLIIEDEYGNWEKIPHELHYQHNGSYYKSIQSLCSSEKFIEEIRNKVL